MTRSQITKLRHSPNSFSGRIRMQTQAIARPVAASLFIRPWTVIFVLLCATMSMAGAAEWKIEPIVRVAADFDDNPFLSIRTDIEESVSGYIVEAAANIAYSSNKTNTSFYVRILTTEQYQPTFELPGITAASPPEQLSALIRTWTWRIPKKFLKMIRGASPLWVVERL